MTGKVQDVYIIGSKGIPAKYGGFETFVEKLTEQQIDKRIQYHVACMKENSEKSNIKEKHFIHNGADCFNIEVPDIGPAKAIYYDIASLNYAIKLAQKNKDKNPVFYVLACRIGPFIKNINKKIKNIGGTLYINPDGHEWLRKKWSLPVRKYWKISEKLMVKNSNLMICDSKTIESYILNDYKKYTPKTTYIAYGTDLTRSSLNEKSQEVVDWYTLKKVKDNNYYLVVGRFVPENNYEAMIKEFMKSETTKDLILITNIEKNNFYNKLVEKTGFENDPRIKFVGTVYNQELLKYIRENAFAYIHGHEVGGTNPSLLEAMFSTKLNLLLDVGFNREVSEDAAIYWEKNKLGQKINKLEKIKIENINRLDKLSTEHIKDNFSWSKIINEYENLFIK